MRNITLGTDPEVFFTQNTSNQTVYPAGAVLAEIEQEHPMDFDTGRVIVDGAALEYQPNPAIDVAELVGNLHDLIVKSVTWLEQWGKLRNPSEVGLVFKPELPLDLKWCEKDPELAQFGCDPDLSVWGEECRPATINAGKHPWRYAGAHIHFGILGDPLYFQQGDRTNLTIRALDRTAGLAAMVIGNGRDARRRDIYGRPGIYRPQPHGLEYRTPSNMLLRSPNLFAYICEITRTTVDLVADGVYPEFAAVVPDELLINILRSGDVVAAREYFSRVATTFGLPNIPATIDVNWRVEWLT